MNFRDLLRWTLSLALGASSLATGATKIRVVTTIPELAWVAREIGGEGVEAVSLLKGTEDPHHVDAVPAFVRLVADADIVCLVGLGLEVGYMPAVLARAGQRTVQPGGPGYCEAGRGITPLDKPTGAVDRSMGDVHPEGNPHFWLSPEALGMAAGEVAQALVRKDPSRESLFNENLRKLRRRLAQLSTEVKAVLGEALARSEVKGRTPVMEYHQELTYFLGHYGIASWGSLEEKPGVPPSAGRIREVAQRSKEAKVRLILAADYSPEAVLAKYREISGIPVLSVQTMMRPGRGIERYEELQLNLARSIAQVLQGASP